MCPARSHRDAADETPLAENPWLMGASSCRRPASAALLGGARWCPRRGALRLGVAAIGHDSWTAWPRRWTERSRRPEGGSGDQVRHAGPRGGPHRCGSWRSARKASRPAIRRLWLDGVAPGWAAPMLRLPQGRAGAGMPPARTARLGQRARITLSLQAHPDSLRRWICKAC